MAASLFDTYMSGLANGPSGAITHDNAWAAYTGSPQYQQYQQLYHQWRQQNPGHPDSANPYADYLHRGGQAFSKYLLEQGAVPGQTAFIARGFQPAYGFVKGGSAAAGGLMRQGYEDAFRARAAGFAGQQAEQQRLYGAQIAGQGLSPDVAMRLAAENRVNGVQQLAGARADYSSGLNTGLAELAKGTGTELAGLSAQEAAALANYNAALKGAKSAQNAAGAAGLIQGGATLAAALI